MAEFLTTKEAGERLDISPQRVLQLIHDGRLPATMFGKAFMINAKDLHHVETRISGWPKGCPRGTPTPAHVAAMVAGRVRVREAQRHRYDEPAAGTEDARPPTPAAEQPAPMLRRRIVRAPKPRPAPQPA